MKPVIVMGSMCIMATPQEASYNHICNHRSYDHNLPWSQIGQIILRQSRIGSLLCHRPYQPDQRHQDEGRTNSRKEQSNFSLHVPPVGIRRAISLPISNQAHIWQSSSTATEGLSL